MGTRRKEYKAGLALSLYNARLKAHISQEYMAQELEVSKKTVISWEKGLSEPTIDRCLEWFDVCDVNPMSAILDIVWPDMPVKDTDTAFEKLFSDLPQPMKQSLIFLFFGKHGSSPEALIQLLLAYLHTPLTARATQAITSANMYVLEKELGRDSCPDEIQPNIDVLTEAINEARHKILKAAEK